MPGGRTTRDHQWLAATNIPITEKMAVHGHRRGTVRVETGDKVDVLQVYCSQCRRAFEDVQGRPCAASFNNDHLIGGPTGERKKRDGSEATG